MTVIQLFLVELSSRRILGSKLARIKLSEGNVIGLFDRLPDGTSDEL